MREKKLVALLLALTMVLGLATQGLGASAAADVTVTEFDLLVSTEAETREPYTVYLPSVEVGMALVEAGILIVGRSFADEGALAVDVELWPDEVAIVEGLGGLIAGRADQAAIDRLKAQPLSQIEAMNQLNMALATDEVRVLRADYYGNTLSVEARTDGPANLILRVYNAETGAQIGGNMSRFVDANTYMYHRFTANVGNNPPARVRVVSTGGGQAERDVTRWPNQDSRFNFGDGFLAGFVTGYMNPTELYERIEALHAEFPNLTEIIELPHLTNGYRRPAMGVTGTLQSHAIVWHTKMYGHEGGNDISVQIVNPGAANSPLSVTFDEDTKTVVVSPATNAAGAVTSTAGEVIDAVMADDDLPVIAFPYRTATPNGVVAPADPVKLTDYLSAPENISREPFQMKVLRICKVCDGSKIGVFVYAQEHAREWQTPLVAIETAERLLRNYGQHADTTSLVDNTDIFILPSVNPDGGHYSFFDYNMQRRNMTMYGPPSVLDPARRNSWGVDINRNFRAGSIVDGYTGASTNPTSDTYMGPYILSEPEAQNQVWLVETYRNIKFSMNIHSHGNYFMWAPGSYKTNPRVTNTRPTKGQEAYFFYAGERILDGIRQHRGLIVTPARTGPIADVLYSAAGTSSDDHWYMNGVYAWSFEVGTSFQPAWNEAFQQAQEYSNGMIEMIAVARDYQDDTTAPESSIKFIPEEGTNEIDVPDGIDADYAFDGPVRVQMPISKPADVYYTLDGSRPTTESTRYELTGPRDQDGEFRLDHSAEIKWFAIDMKGNTENGYDPDGSGDGYNEVKVLIITPPELTVTAPEDNSHTNRFSVDITGHVANPVGVVVTVNDEEVDVNADGSFSHRALIEEEEGANVYTITATNLLGESTTVTRTVHHDSVAPELANIAPAEDVTIEQGETVTISFDSEPGLEAAYDVILPGVMQKMALNSLPGTPMEETGEGRYEATFTAPADVTFAGAEIMVFARDKAGNMTAASADGTLTVIPYVAPPELTVTEPADGLLTRSGYVIVKGTATDASGDVTVTVNGEEAVLDEDGNFEETVFLEEGDNPIDVVATNAGGKSTSVSLTVKRDTTPPDLTDIQPAEDVVLAHGDSVTISFTSEPGLDAAYDIELAGLFKTMSSAGNPMTETSAGVYEATFTAPAGVTFANARVFISAIDAAGNETQAYADGRITVAEKPTVDVTSPADGLRTSLDVITVSGTASDPLGLKSLTVNGRKVNVGADGSFSTRIIVSEGTNIVTVTAENNVGLTTTVTRTVEAVWSPPTLSDLQPAEDITLTAGESYVFRFTAAPGLTAAYQVVLGGTPGTTVGKGVPKGTPMTEVSPGVYEATYTAPANTNFSNAVIRFNVADDLGNLIMMTAPGRLSVQASAPEPAAQ